MSRSHTMAPLSLTRLPIVAWLSPLALVFLLGAAPQTQPSAGDWVSRKEYEQLKADHQALKDELDQIKKQLAQPPAPAAPGKAAEPAVTGEDIDAIEKEIHDIHDQMKSYKLGTETVVFAGDANFGFSSQRHNPSSFFADFSPLILWKPTDRLIFEAALDFAIGNDNFGSDSTTVSLQIAQGTYLVNDYLAVGGGLFVAPFAAYHPHFDPPWINKLPDDPLPFAGNSIAPNQVVGLYALGGAPIGNMKLEYSLYVSNSPNLNTTDPGAAGTLNFHSFNDLKSEKSVGGRVGLQPIPEVDLGYSAMGGQANPQGFQHVGYLVQAVDASYRKDLEQIGGVLDLNGSWVWSDVQKATFDSDGTLGFGPTRFGNARSGGYVLVAYRPTHASAKLLRDLEFVARYDVLIVPVRAPGGDHEQRYTLGVDYWLSPSAVLKFAYEFDHRKVSPGEDAFLFQFGIGL